MGERSGERHEKEWVGGAYVLANERGRNYGMQKQRACTQWTVHDPREWPAARKRRLTKRYLKLDGPRSTSSTADGRRASLSPRAAASRAQREADRALKGGYDCPGDGRR